MMKKQQAWQQYWQQGKQQSCIASEGEQHLVKKLWLDWQLLLPKQSIVLDLATGNGAVITNLLDGGNTSEHQYTGVDYAKINPPALREDLAKFVSFIEEADIANLPLADHSVDGVTSQFGFEYAEQKAAVLELIRVLRCGGHFQLIIHHANGEIVRANKQRFSELSLLMAEGSLIDNAKDFVYDRLSLDQIEVKAQTFIKQHQTQLTKSITGQVLESINQAIFLQQKQKQDHSNAKSMITLLENKLAAEQARLAQLLNVAKSESSIEALVNELQSYGAICQHSEVLTEDKLTFAWLIQGVKNG